jgi:hypothetical protein
VATAPWRSTVRMTCPMGPGGSSQTLFPNGYLLRKHGTRTIDRVG